MQRRNMNEYFIGSAGLVTTNGRYKHNTYMFFYDK